MSNLATVAEKFPGVLLDAYGVFWGGNKLGLLPGAKEAMETLIRDGKIVGVLSNSTQLAAKEIEKLKNHELEQGSHFHFFITSGEIAKTLFSRGKLPFPTPRKTFWLLGKPHPKFSTHLPIFQNTPYYEVPNLADADFVYAGVPHRNGEDQTDPEVFRSEVFALQNHLLPMVCPNPDRFAHEGQPPQAVVRQGSLALFYEEIGGKVFYIGKPSRSAYSLAMEQFYAHKIYEPHKILMVGDTPETDIRGARSFGMASALITGTGIMADRIARLGRDLALQNLTAADYPDLFLERFD